MAVLWMQDPASYTNTTRMGAGATRNKKPPLISIIVVTPHNCKLVEDG